jgi:hypothetical protein
MSTNEYYAVNFEKRLQWNDVNRKYEFHSNNGFVCFGNSVKISSLGDPIFYANDQFYLARYVNVNGELIKIKVITKVRIGPHENYYTPEESNVSTSSI